MIGSNYEEQNQLKLEYQKYNIDKYLKPGPIINQSNFTDKSSLSSYKNEKDKSKLDKITKIDLT